jgi:hypothetical protein
MEESSGTRVDDVGTQNITETGSVGSATGIVGNCATFSAGNYLSHGYNAAAQAGQSGNGATWSVWFRRSAAPSGNAGFCGENTGSSPYFGFRINSSGRLAGFARNSGGTNFISEASGDHCDDGWHMATMVWDPVSKVTRLYLDASQVATSTTAGGGTTLTNNSVGVTYGRDASVSADWGRDNPTRAYLDQFAVWDRNLSGAEITSLYNSGAGLHY